MMHLNHYINRMKYILFLFILFSCNEKKSIDANNIKGEKSLKDSADMVIEGPNKYYDSNKKLINITTYKMGKKEGPYINYFPNGAVSDSGFYHDDLANGYWIFFDSTGSKIYSTYFYNNLEYGPQLWYKSNYLYKFEFLSFDKTSLAVVTYKGVGEIDRLYYFNMVVHILPKNDQDLNLFAYLPKIPGTSQHFAIGIKNNKNTKELYAVNGYDFIIDTLLRPPPTGWNYYISCHIQDKSGSYNKIFLEQVNILKR
jgi:hypothetical protein